MGPGHPEQPARLAAVGRAIGAAGLEEHLERREAPEVTREALLRAHPASYLDELAARAPDEGTVMLDGDTLMNPWSLPAAMRAAGAGVAAVDAVVAGEWPAAFCAVRPPGHHAERATAMGFCFFGNIAIAALHALEVHGLRRVAICDFDVHHGNGTEDIIDGDERILFCTTFQYPLFPGYYREDVPAHRINRPLNPGTGGPLFRETVRKYWLPELEDFAPEMILISAGFDAHEDDPIGNMRLDEGDFHWITAELAAIADRHAGGRIVSMLEGGYDLDALGRSTVAHLRALLRMEPDQT